MKPKTKKHINHSKSRTHKIRVLRIPMLSKYAHVLPAPGLDITQAERESDPLFAKEGRFFELKEYPVGVVRESSHI